MSHFMTKCSKCDAIITQCRCPDPNKTIKYEICSSCKDKTKVAEVSEDKTTFYEKEISAVLDMIPEEFRVRVREGAGSENLAASLAISVAKLVIRAQQKF